MAHNDVEIEIKIPINEDKFSELTEKLKSIAKFIKSSGQVDEYYTPAHRNFVATKLPFEWLSIRRRGGKNILSYKHWYPENAWVTTHCDEYETVIDDPERLEKILAVLNFKKLCVVDKVREIYLYNDELEIGLDNVKDLGYFIEIEAVKNLGSVEDTRQKLFDVAKMLNIDISNPDARGYAYLMCKKNGLIID